MGRASRMKAERRRNQVSGTTRPSKVVSTGRVGFDVLSEAVIAVGNVYGTEANCAPAAALLKETARHLGYELVPRAVSVLARHKPTGTHIAMGPRATERFRADAVVENHLPGGRDNGHVILTTDDPSPLLFDPNLRQLGALGFEMPSVVMKIKSIAPASGNWGLELGDIGLVYIIDNETTVLLDYVRDATPPLREAAAWLAVELRKGRVAAEIASEFRVPKV